MVSQQQLQRFNLSSVVRALIAILQHRLIPRHERWGVVWCWVRTGKWMNLGALVYSQWFLLSIRSNARKWNVQEESGRSVQSVTASQSGKRFYYLLSAGKELYTRIPLMRATAAAFRNFLFFHCCGTMNAPLGRWLWDWIGLHRRMDAEDFYYFEHVGITVVSRRRRRRCQSRGYYLPCPGTASHYCRLSAFAKKLCLSSAGFVLSSTTSSIIVVFWKGILEIKFTEIDQVNITRDWKRGTHMSTGTCIISLRGSERENSWRLNKRPDICFHCCWRD